jgi:ribosome-binding protein aMBF1 (putative translation factor)
MFIYKKKFVYIYIYIYMESTSDEQLLDHQDWKKIILNPSDRSKKSNNISNNSQVLNIIKKIENKADNDDLKHAKYTIEFRKNLVNARTSKLNMTQKQFASRLNLPEKTIKDIEAGKAIYNAQHHNKIKRILKI